MKVVELTKMNNFYFGCFSSCWEKSKVILEFLLYSSSNWNFPQIGIWISKCFIQIHTLPFRISFGPLKMFCSIQNSEQLLFWHKFDFNSTFGSNLQNTEREGICLATVIRWAPGAPLPSAAAERAEPRTRPAATQLLAGRVTARRGRPRPLRLVLLSTSAAGVAFLPSQSKKTPTSILAKFTTHAFSSAELSSPPSPPFLCEPRACPGQPSPLSKRSDHLLPLELWPTSGTSNFLMVRPSQEVPSCGKRC